MYPEASIKLRSPKTHVRVESKQLINSAENLTSVSRKKIGAMNRGALSDLLFIGSFKRPLMKKRDTPQNAKWLIQKIFGEKRATPQNAKGLIQKTSNEERGTPQNAKGLLQKDLQ
jgi:hypothetical protein